MNNPNEDSLTFFDLLPTHLSVKEEVVQGLMSTPKRLPSKLFYDDRGSELFARITGLQEYYLTRSETEILRTHSDSIRKMLPSKATMVEFGSGNLSKISLLLDSLDDVEMYVPIDISREMLIKSSRELSIKYPLLRIHAICSDYDTLSRELIPSDNRKVFLFLGSTIGNFEPMNAIGFLSRVRSLMNVDDGFLLGCDRVKDKAILELAYNDPSGVTAEFNLNIIARISRDLGLALRTEDFEHLAFYNEEQERIEMHLVAKRDQTIRVDKNVFFVKKGELIHTENSYKYTRDSFSRLAAHAGLNILESWTDSNSNFWLFYLGPS